MGRSQHYSVVSARLPSGEGLPLLVYSGTGLPVRLALRWIVYQRRFEVAENTLRADLYGVRLLYQWADQEYPHGLEGRLGGVGGLDHSELLRLDAYLRTGAGSTRRTVRSGGPLPSVVGRRVVSIIAFLKWAIVPASRNERGAPPADASALVSQVDAVLRPMVRMAARTNRISPLPEGADEVVDRALAPRLMPDGTIARPLKFRRDNPFRRSSRLRNWLLWTLIRDCGLRLGEALTLQADDFPMVEGTKCVRVVRRPDAPEDVRLNRPQVKTLGRLIPLSARSHDALRAYMTERPPLGRRMGSPYLFTSRVGRPLGVTSASAIFKRLRATGLIPAGCSWHSLRHTWAEEYATHLFAEGGDQHLIIDKLRYLGGWSPTSSMPAYYAQLAIGTQARKDLSNLQGRYARRIGGARSS